VFLALAVATTLLALVLRSVGDRRYAVGASVAFVGHLLVTAAALRYLPYGWDVRVYHETALRLLAGEQAGGSYSTVAFGRVVASLYTLFGSEVFVVAVFNALLAVLIPLPVAVVARSLYPSVRGATGVRTVVLFLPGAFLFLGLPMRDTLALALFAAALAVLAYAFADDIRYLLASAPFVAALVQIRGELAGLVAAGGALALAVYLIERYADRPVSVPQLVTATGAVGLAGFIPFSTRYDMSTLNRQVQIRGTGGAAYLTPFEYDSWFDVFLAAPIRAVYFQFAPFPLHVTGLFDAVALAELPLLIAVTAAAARSLWAREWSRPVGALLGVAYAGGVVGYGLVDANFGTTVRHRVPFVVLLVVFAAPVVELWWRSAASTLGDTLSIQRKLTSDR